MKRLLILDGNSLLNRAFYAVPLLSNSEGTHTNAIYGFTNMLFKMREDIKPDYIVCTFDKKAPTFRHLEYGDYKAGRKKMPPELAEQFPIVKEMLKLFSITTYELDGFEADDIIGSLAKVAEGEGIEVYIMTGDKDALQLAAKDINVCITKKGVSEIEVYNYDRMVEEYGVTPTQFIDVKGLMGDKSDNIPGVPGVGEKTAFKLIKEYGSVEAVLENIDNISGKKLKENLTEYSEQAIFSKKLATIMTNVPIDFDLDEIKSKDDYNKDQLKALFTKLQMKSILDKLSNGEEEEPEIEVKITNIENNKELEDLFKNINEEVYINFTYLNKEKYSTIEIDKIFINYDEKNYLINFKELAQEEENIKAFKEFFENEDILKNGYSIKNALTALKKLGIEFKGLAFDCELAAYLIDSSKGEYTLLSLINNYLSKFPNVKEGEEYLVGISFMKELTLVLKKKIEEEKMEKLMYDIELPLETVLSSMESIGFKVNKDILDELSIKFKRELEETQKEIFELADEEFNINSPKQLGKILFEKLDLPVIKKTKTGYSTNAEVLEKLKDKHPIIEKITYFRQLSKIYSTYVEGLKSVIDTDGSIHSTFNQTVTTTGRLSSTEPNLQNIPIKYEMGREIRRVFIPKKEGDLLISADYSQIELRVLAHISGDENMIDAFNHHSDIHTKTASEVFKVPVEEVTPLMRSRAKAVNFGIVYGIGDFSLSQDLNISRKEAKEYMDIYFERYPKIKEYISKVIHEAQTKGYVLTMLNRRRYIPEANASNKIVKALGERLAMNAPIQGTAADIIKLAMVNVYNKLKELNLNSKLILQVHDELIINVVKGELDIVKKLLKEEMENTIKLSVPLDVDVNVGEDWYKLK
ncbi:DNA polymerase I [Clostridium perfringens]|uniref:DNA polymerase I n=1 Tax=Clostridium perfringens TaxID=1502 RepID=UPI001898CA8C|nr:DNA polymerase I [Clostridium perfringens]MBI6006249.1 DNA polymerase I [Clostridium perfringens]MBI6016788.1 DNA polymerase I [Clostridium perfringens]MDK0528013.1 DNA polymerase I [Clostridium perfringens]MDK0556144.1 DNA polymerase I [Clostridium perfringens]MDK0587302.1 DNA polymerase I [Clostridium perfringens]